MNKCGSMRKMQNIPWSEIAFFNEVRSFDTLCAFYNLYTLFLLDMPTYKD